MITLKNSVTAAEWRQSLALRLKNSLNSRELCQREANHRDNAEKQRYSSVGTPKPSVKTEKQS
ncbi:hypothetical protein GCM10008018_01250 [Paenibacillus marchantiophytorum]|uniref:Uncharacterized protein n=1 Tax=Paenibacillus marchantiophytorum TaxID=1619310 RepID=A0ABQ2BMY2_9BACL|nr:hypothetical protein GCM10008018_01250 [Paenibacillus marchantiophytorum]